MSNDSTTAGIDLSLRHLETELLRIDVLIHREVLRWQLAGQDPTDAFRGQYVSDAEASVLVKRPFGMSWGQTVALKPEERQAYANALARAEQHVHSLVETAQRQGHTLRLEHLTMAFGLDRFDLDTLLVCLAPTLDLRYEKLYGYLQDDVTRKRPSVNLVLDLLCGPGTDRLLRLSHFADDAPLFRYHILERVSEPGPGKPPLLSHTLAVDEAIVAWLLGEYQPHADLGAHATLLWPEEDEVDRFLAAPLETQLDLAMHGGHSADGQPVVVSYGPDEASQAAAARRLAAQTGRPLLTVDLEAVAKAEQSPSHALRLALRDARLTDAILYLAGWDVYLTKDGTPPPDLLAQLYAHPDCPPMSPGISTTGTPSSSMVIRSSYWKARLLLPGCPSRPHRRQSGRRPLWLAHSLHQQKPWHRLPRQPPGGQLACRSALLIKLMRPLSPSSLNESGPLTWIRRSCSR